MKTGNVTTFQKVLLCTVGLMGVSLVTHAQQASFWLELEDVRRNRLLSEEPAPRLGVVSSLSRVAFNDPERSGLVIAPLYSYASWNSGYTTPAGDGAQWQGRGLNWVATGGLEWTSEHVHVALRPEIWVAQNLAYDILPAQAGTTEWGDYLTGIDRPQRFGDDPLFRVWPGQSGAWLRWRFLGVGITSENFILGPARYNPIIMGPGAAGIPRIELGTLQPAQTRIGEIEALSWWGLMSESAFYDDDSSNDLRFHLGYSLGYSPAFAPELRFGFHRVYHSPLETVTWGKAFQHVDTFFKSRRDNSSGDDDITQTASLTFQWFFPRIRSEFYAEWARNDHTWDLEDFMLNPEHSEALVLGFQHTMEIRGLTAIWDFETARLGNNETTTEGSPRPTFPYYRHGPVEQGDTQLGQVIGAPIGPGSNMQTVGFTALPEDWSLTFRFTRIAHDNDYYLQFAPVSLVGERTSGGYWVEGIWSIAGTYDLDEGTRLYADIAQSITWNRNWSGNAASTRFGFGIRRAF